MNVGFNPSFGGYFRANTGARKIPFTSRVTYVSPLTALTQAQKDFIDKFEETPDGQKTTGLNCKYLGEGVCSKAYLSNYHGFVIKQNKPHPDIPRKYRGEMGSLAHENDILQAIDPHVEATQRGIAYAETEKGGQFLISTYVRGNRISYPDNPMAPKHIDRLLRNLYRLDKSNILNSDLSGANLLMDDIEKKVNVIDYQWGEKIAPEGPNYIYKNFSFPPFESPSNIVAYEGAALAGYIQKMPTQTGRVFLKNYLMIKADYAEKKVKKLEELHTQTGSFCLPERIEFEKAKACAYKNPTDDVLDAELLKMDIIKNHRHQYYYVDKNVVEPRNVLEVVGHCMSAKFSADKLANFRPSSGSFNQKYFSYMNKYGEHWQNNCKRWYPDTLRWVYDLVAGYEQDPAKIYFPGKIEVPQASYSGLKTYLQADKNHQECNKKIAEIQKLYLEANKTSSRSNWAATQSKLEQYF